MENVKTCPASATFNLRTQYRYILLGYEGEATAVLLEVFIFCIIQTIFCEEENDIQPT